MTKINTPSTPAANSHAHQRMIEALQAVLNEVDPQPGQRAFSHDSYLPLSITTMVHAALADIAADTQEIERHQLAFNALSTASWHLARGNAPAALARMRRAATHIKSAESA